MTLSTAQRPPLASFDHDIVLSPHSDGIHWQLVKAYRVQTDQSAGYIIDVPRNFVTDFASVPRVFWILLPPWGRYGRAAIVHDYLYTRGSMKRSVCDRIFLDLMQRSGTSTLQRWLMYSAVRLFGWRAWRVHRTSNESKILPEIRLKSTDNSK